MAWSVWRNAMAQRPDLAYDGKFRLAGIPSQPDSRETPVGPLGCVDRGNVGFINWDEVPDGVELGASVMNSYDVLVQKGWSLFGEIGIGLGWMTNTPDTNLVGDSLIGFLDYGVGVKFKTAQGFVIKIGPRFHHRSDVTVRDAGMNGYGVMVSVTR